MFCSHVRTTDFLMITVTTRALRQRKPPPTSKYETSDPGFDSDFRINPDLDPYVCRICPKMLWMHYLVDVISPSMVQIGR